MSAVAEIEAAIEKLTGLRDAASLAPWNAWKQCIPGSRMTHGVEDARGYDLAKGTSAADAELIAALHRTIDAQLAILREGATIAEFLVSPDEDAEVANFVNLARAINGTA